MKLDYKSLLKKYWPILVLLIIFIISLQVRLFSSSVENLTALDPYFHFRYTEMVVEQGSLPSWDYYSYAPGGRPLDAAPLMYYVTAYLYKGFGWAVDWDLTRFAILMPALFGALTVIPSYLLGREFSGPKAGLMAAVFIGLSPAILQRTMAGFYDTDGLVIFFSIFTMWAFVRAFKKVKLDNKTFKGCLSQFFKERGWIHYSIAAALSVLFALTWPPAWYIPIIAFGSTFVYWGLLSIFGKKEWIEETEKKRIKPDFVKRIKLAFPEFLKLSLPTFTALVVAIGIIEAMGYGAIRNILFLANFATDPTAVQIVNQSVAELQKVSLFADGLGQFYSRLSMAIIFSIAGVFVLFKRSMLLGSVLLTWSLVSFVSILQGIRFMLVFAPAVAIASGVALADIYKGLKHTGDYSILVGLGLLAAAWVSLANPLLAFFIAIAASLFILFMNAPAKIDKMSRVLVISAMVLSAIITISQGAQVASAYQGSEPIEGEWEEAYQFLRENTAEDAIVGTWWDPGHRIATVGDRRNIADGAHCGSDKCNPGLNQRITDLGLIFSTSDENLAKETLLKYRGEGEQQASEMYWIVSDDLIQKYQWLQYFGTGCDFRVDQSCGLYTKLDSRSYSYRSDTYEITGYNFVSNVQTQKNNGIWIAGVSQEDQFIPFNEQITHSDGIPVSIRLDSELDALVWIHPNSNYIVVIPDSIRDNMLTRMFFYEGNGLENFELVFRNDKVKIFRLVI